MSPVSSRGMPRRVQLALLGAALGLGTLSLPWLASSSPALPDLLGYQDSVVWVAVRVIAAVGSAVLALRLIKIPDLRETQRAVFAGTAGVFIVRPVTLVLTNPTSGDFSAIGLKIDQVFAPSWGIYLSLLAGAVMIAAAVLTHRSDDAKVEAEREAARAALLLDPELAAFAGPPPAPLTPVAAPAPEPAVEAAPAPIEAFAPEPVEALAPEPVQVPVPEPVAEVAPRPVEALAPEPVQVPVPEPVSDHSPYIPAAASRLSVMPQPPAEPVPGTPAPAEPRRSVAPPGFG